MRAKTNRCFSISAGTLLLITAVAKLASSGGNAKLLDLSDAVLGIHFRYLFVIAGVLEMAVALVCLFGENELRKAKLVAWLSLILLTYRICLGLLGTSEVCGCLGTLTNAIYLSPSVADVLMKIILGYLLVGSVAVLFCSRNRATAVRSGHNPA